MESIRSTPDRSGDRPSPAAGLRRWRNVCLVAAVGLITVAIPPLLVPDRDQPADDGSALRDRARVPDVVPAGSAQPSTTTSSSASPRPSSSVSVKASASASPGKSPAAASTGTPMYPAAEGPAACAASGGAAFPPACQVYTSHLGGGWQLAGAGVRVFQSEKVPDTDVVAIRIEPKDDVAGVWLTAGAPATVPPTLKFRVFGGRTHGTVAKVTVSPSSEADRARPVTVSVPPDVWREFSVPVAQLSGGGGLTVQRIDFQIVSEAVPSTYRFFIDDIAFVG